MDSPLALKLSLPPPETFHTLNTVVLVGQNPRPACCGTPSRRFRDYDSEPRGWFPKISVTEAGADAKLKLVQQKYNPKSHRKKRSQISVALGIARPPCGLAAPAIAVERRLLGAHPSCAVPPVGIASAHIIHIFAGTRALPGAISGGFGKRTRS